MKTKHTITQSQILKGHTDAVNALCVTPDSKSIISGSKDKTIRMWNINTDTCKKLIEADSKSVNALGMTPDGKYALTGGGEGVLRMWNIEDGKNHKELEKQYSEINALAVTKDGRYAVTGMNSGRILKWDLQTGSCVTICEKHPAYIGYSGIIRSSNKEIAYNDFQTNLAYAYTYDINRLTLLGHADSINALSVTANGKYILTGSNDSTIRLWDSDSGKCLWIFGGYGGESIVSPYSLNITPNGRYVISGTSGMDIWRFGLIRHKLPDMLRFIFWRFSRSKPSRKIKGTDGTVHCADITPNGKYLAAAAGWNGMVAIFKIRNGKAICLLQGHKSRVNALALTHDKQLATGSDQGTIRIWDLNNLI